MRGSRWMAFAFDGNFFSIGSHSVFALILMFALNMMMDINELILFHLTPMGDAAFAHLLDLSRTVFVYLNDGQQK